MEDFSAVAQQGLRRIFLGARGSVLVGRGSRTIQPFDRSGWQCAVPIAFLRLKTRRAVVYRGPRLGASIGLAHRSLRVSAVHLGGITGLFGSLAPPIMADTPPSSSPPAAADPLSRWQTVHTIFSRAPP